MSEWLKLTYKVGAFRAENQTLWTALNSGKCRITVCFVWWVIYQAIYTNVAKLIVKSFSSIPQSWHVRIIDTRLRFCRRAARFYSYNYHEIWTAHITDVRTRIISSTGCDGNSWRAIWCSAHWCGVCIGVRSASSSQYLFQWLSAPLRSHIKSHWTRLMHFGVVRHCIPTDRSDDVVGKYGQIDGMNNS